MVLYSFGKMSLHQLAKNSANNYKNSCAFPIGLILSEIKLSKMNFEEKMCK